MKLKVKVDAESGAAYIAVIDPRTGDHVKSATVSPGQEVELTFADVHDAAGIEFGEPVASGVDAPAEPPAGGGEQPPAPTGGDGSGDQGGGEAPPTTSAASEKPLYKVDGDTIPEGFVVSGLETPGDETLYHFNGDTEGQAATGNVDGVSVYADADDNEKPVQVATPAEGEAATS